jgi:lipopolysaccharide biosynthesis protein
VAASRVRLIATYLPQYHPIPENDEWWGAGFTEWTNVTRARRLFPGHYQPHLPSELGFYDLRLPESREAQAALARAHGIHGFAYYHYWFNGRRLLQRPFDEVRASGRPDFPFLLCWANENWTRIWDGGTQRVLLQQHYSSEDDRAHIRWLIEVFRDPRYITVEGKPFFAIYRPSHMPDVARTLDLWREEAARAGLPGLYLCRVEAFPGDRDDLRAGGFDAAVEFQPDWPRLGPLAPSFVPVRLLRRLRLCPPPLRTVNLFRYPAIVERSLSKPEPAYKRYRCVMPGWDNTARRYRRQGAMVVLGNTPERYEHWLGAIVERFRPYSPQENFVFVNAWNEWAEGNHLEPDQRWGRGFLEATRRAYERGA